MGRAMLLLVSGLVVIAGIIQMNNSNRSELLPQRTVDKYYEQQVRNISASLVDKGINQLLLDMEWEGTITTNDNYEGQGTLTTIADPNDEYKVTLVSTAQYGGYKAQTEVLMRRDSFSKYSYFTDEELMPSGSEIWWINGDEVTGPIHTNGTFRMSGSPVFNGRITSPNDWVGYSSTNKTSNDPDIRHGDDEPQFLGGANFNLNHSKNLPGVEQLAELSDLADIGGLVFNSDADLEFFVQDDEGYVKETEITSYTCGYHNNQACYNETDYRLSDYPNGIIKVEGKAKVKGAVKGGVTLYSTEEIEIMGDIYYHDNPLDTTKESSDLLGLVSAGDVIVDRYAHRDHGSSDLTIHASIMALNTSFKVEDYNSTYIGLRGTLNLLGGIIQQNRGAVSTFYNSSIYTGFSKNYVYDERLYETIPPHFPRESIFSIVYWRDKPIKKIGG